MKKRSFIFRSNRTVVREKVKEAFSSVLPIALIVLVLCFTLVPMDSGMLLSFAVGVVCVIVGIGLFSLGADTAMTPIGEYVGSSVMRTKRLWAIALVCFVVGVMITISEPDLQVLATQLKKTMSAWTLILSVGVGVGIFLVVAFFRIVLKLRFSYLLIALYSAVFILSAFVPSAFVPLAFDSGGVTTGPMSVPFIISIGTGLVAMRSDKSAETDGFGLTALCSVGPIFAVMILGIIFRPESIDTSTEVAAAIGTSYDLLHVFGEAIPHYAKEVAIALAPIVAFFFIFQLFGSKLAKQTIIKIMIGVAYTYVGLVLFLLGVNVGFLPVGRYLGEAIGQLSYNWIIVPIGMVIGYFVVAAEPAVHVLTKQVYEITSGAIPQKALRMSLMIGVSASVGLAMLRILCNIPVMAFLIPGYLFALLLTFFVPDMFTAIAFDSGGVASGAMTASFLMPLALGICGSVGADVARQGFGVVAMVAMTPLITIQLLGLLYKKKMKKLSEISEQQAVPEEIIE